MSLFAVRSKSNLFCCLNLTFNNFSLAGNCSVTLSLVDGIKEHRLKLWLKAMEVVLCGYSQCKFIAGLDL